MPYEWKDEAGTTPIGANGVLLSCFPSAGLAAIVAAHYIVRSLHLPRNGLFEGAEATPIAVIQSGEVHPPVRAYGRPDFGIVLSEFPPSIAASRSIAQAIMDGAQRRKARMIVCLEGVVPHPISDEEPESDESVWVTTSRADPQVQKAFEAAKAKPLEEGVIGGVTGALLVLGISHPIPVAAVLVSASSTEGFPDHRASAVLIETLDRLLPELKIDTGPLRTQAELIEKALRQALKAHSARGENGPPMSSGPEPPIYQ